MRLSIATRAGVIAITGQKESANGKFSRHNTAPSRMVCGGPGMAAHVDERLITANMTAMIILDGQESGL